MQVEALVGRAETAIRGGDLQQAVRMLEEAARIRPDDASLWLRIGAMHRGTNDLGAALDAVHKALAIEPRDFTALLMRASLLQRIGDAQAGEAWGHALAQKPAGDLPKQIADAVAEGERYHQAWLEARDSRMRQATEEAERRAGDEELGRIERFRTNALRTTRPFHSDPTHFHFPGLVEREFHPPRLFPWFDELEAATESITEELAEVMSAERAELVPYVQYDEHLPLDQWRELNRNLDWTAIHLLQNGELVEANARYCPRTLAILENIPQPKIAGVGPNAMFSLLAPNTRIPPHVGVANTRLVCHLPLVVPEGCWFRVGAETRFWRRGEALVFDDTIEHEAMNPSDELRVVFIFDVWHPDLSEVERAAVSALLSSESANAPL